MPLTEATRGLLSSERIARMRPGAFLINCARGGLVDDAALLQALDEGRLGGAGVDVFAQEPVAQDDPLPRHPKVVATPHLGASTVEAQANVAAQVASEVLAVLESRPAQFAVNAPSLRPEDIEALEPYLDLVVMLGKLATQLADDHVRSVEVTYRGEIAERNVGVLTAAAYRGCSNPSPIRRSTWSTPACLPSSAAWKSGKHALPPPSTTRVWYGSRSIRGRAPTAWPGSSRMAERTWCRSTTTNCICRPRRGIPGHPAPRPAGMIGLVGTVLGQADINISSMQVGRHTRRGDALMVLAVDERVPPEVVERIRQAASVASIKVIKL